MIRVEIHQFDNLLTFESHPMSQAIVYDNTYCISSRYNLYPKGLS